MKIVDLCLNSKIYMDMFFFWLHEIRPFWLNDFILFFMFIPYFQIKNFIG